DPSRFSVRRDPKQTSASISAQMIVPGRSAARIVLRGHWEDLNDDANADSQPTFVRSDAEAFKVKLDHPVDEIRVLEGSQDFLDTKHHPVYYSFVAWTRFPQYFPADANPLTRQSPHVLVHVPSSVRPPPPKVLYIIPTFGWKRSATD